MSSPKGVKPDERTVVPNGKLIRDFRKKADLTLDELARKVGVSTATLGPVERNDKPVFVATLHAIVQALNETELVSTDYEQLLMSEGSPSPYRIPVPTDEFPTVRPGLNRLFQLPKALPDFTGREGEIRRMVERLRTDGGAIGISALRGMGGVGKTSLAVRVAREVAQQYPDGQLVHDLQGMSDRPLTTAEAMTRIIRDFYPNAEKLPENENDLLPSYLGALAGKRALIVFDNARDSIQVKQLVTAPAPIGFIVTSRSALALDGVESISLDVLPSSEALRLLHGIVSDKGTEAELKAVVELCGRLPLALRVAGDLLRLKESWTLPWFIKVVEEERLKWLKIHGDPQKDVEAVLKLSAAQLVRDDGELAVRWHLLAVWPGDFAADAAQATWETEPDENEVINDLSELVGRSLLLFDPSSRRYRMHDLMQPIATGLFG